MFRKLLDQADDRRQHRSTAERSTEERDRKRTGTGAAGNDPSAYALQGRGIRTDRRKKAEDIHRSLTDTDRSSTSERQT